MMRIQKFTVAGVLVIALASSLFDTAVSAANTKVEEISIIVDGNKINFTDAKPFKDNAGRIQAPISFIGKALGAELKTGKADYRYGLNYVTFRTKKSVAEFYVGSSSFDIYGGLYSMDTKAITKDNRIYTPIRYVAEALGALVKWDAVNNTVILISGSGTPLIDYDHPKGSADYTEEELVGRYGQLAKGLGKKFNPGKEPIEIKELIEGFEVFPKLPKNSNLQMTISEKGNQFFRYFLSVDFAEDDIDLQLKDLETALMGVFPSFAVPKMIDNVKFVGEHEQSILSEVPNTSIYVEYMRSKDTIKSGKKPIVNIYVYRKGLKNFPKW